MIERHYAEAIVGNEETQVILISDMISHLRDKRSQFLSDADGTRRWVIEEIMRELGEKV